MFVTDFDGTLADDNSKVSVKAISELNRIGENGVTRVIATGRSLFSLRKVIPRDFPIDYLVFSSGIGVYDWKKSVLLQENSITADDTHIINDFLVENKYDFMAHLPVPDNHMFYHFSSGQSNGDFQTRLKYYENHGVAAVVKCPITTSQFVIICPKENDHLRIISNQFKHLKVIKATSPIDKKSIWIEILPKGISKASGINFIKEKLNIKLSNIVAVGNDYYDLDMLNFTEFKNSYVVSNAPAELKSRFNIIDSNNNDAVANLIARIYNV